MRRPGLILIALLWSLGAHARAADCAKGYVRDPTGHCVAIPPDHPKPSELERYHAAQPAAGLGAHAAQDAEVHGFQRPSFSPPSSSPPPAPPSHPAYFYHQGSAAPPAPLYGAPYPSPPPAPDIGIVYSAPSPGPGPGGGPYPPPPPAFNQLVPVRAYLRNKDIPPPGIGAYGVVALQALPTPDELGRLQMLCNAYKAYLPPQASVSGSVAVGDQMLTIWPVDDPTAPPVQADDCNYVLNHYDQMAGYTAIRDAGRQHHKMTGRGPFLIGWSPSNTRGVPNKLVLVIDMSRYTSQSSFDHAFQFWKTEVVENPELWQQGFHLDMLKYALADFLNQYGDDLFSAVKLIK